MTYLEITTIFSLFTLGFLGSFSHCVGMCGPFVLTQVSSRLGEINIKFATNFRRLQGLALLPYHLGRITTYCLITCFSAVLSANLKNITGFKNFAGVLLIVAALIFFNSTIAKIKLPFRVHSFLSSKLELTIVNKILIFFRQKIKILINSLFLNSTGFKNYFLGLTLGFIPCGLVYGAIAASLSLNNFWQTGLAMLAFGIGTVPGLFFTACGGFWFFSKLSYYLNKFTKILILINLTTLLFMAFGLIFNQL